ncbi:Molybdopterin synthase catalytic subunit [Podospora conica]|nr:Molybdopterin synthase catalytic subunit [Schizothecium conicum]
MSQQDPPPNHTPHQPPLTPDPSTLTSEGCYVALTLSPLSVPSLMDRVRSPAAGAIVIFAGTTRNTFANLPVSHLSYSAYPPLALRSMLSICADVRARHDLQGVAMAHRLGDVPIGEESIVIAVSAAHRGAAWRAGEEALEAAKARVEVWKREEFAEEVGVEGVWRANRDGGPGGPGTGAVSSAKGEGGVSS